MADIYGHLPRGPAGVMKAAIWSIQGLRSAWLHESSFRLEVCLFVVLGPLGWLLGAVAGICLIIGGIGIMNIMLVSVTERIREIGLRMAVGAGPGDVQRQFLAEAMLISLIGGVIGIAIGVVGALLIGKFSGLPVQLNLKVVMLAAAFSIGTGLFFGYYPARKASLLDPIEALRQQ